MHADEECTFDDLQHLVAESASQRAEIQLEEILALALEYVKNVSGTFAECRVCLKEP